MASEDVEEAFELDRSRLTGSVDGEDGEGEPNCCLRAAVFFGTVRMLGVEADDEVGVVAGTRTGSTTGEARGDEAGSFLASGG